MVKEGFWGLKVARQIELLEIPRSSYYYHPQVNTFRQETEFQLLKVLDSIYSNYPFLGSRRVQIILKQQWFCLWRYKVMSLMQKLWLKAIYPKKRTTIPHPEHEKYPYLLKEVQVTKVNQVWSTDITYIKMKTGFVYLVAILDWYSRKVLSWKISTTMDSTFCLEVLNESIERYGTPEIFNSDQWSQFTSYDFTKILEQNRIAISMDGKWRYADNIYSERLWRTIKQEEVYLHHYTSPLEAIQWIGKYITFYNEKRPHQSLQYLTPNEVYNGAVLKTKIQTTY